MVFYKTKKYNLKKYSLDLFKCKKCSLVQLNNNFISENLFGKEYGYETSVSNLMIEHLKEKKFRFIKYKYIKKNSNILDIGCNDGTFLNLFSKSYNSYGIDPSAIKFKKKYITKILN